jgi:DNA-binding response OmpR family regulator
MLVNHQVSMKVLLIEGDQAVASDFRSALSTQQHDVVWVSDAVAAADAIADPIYDIALLDLGLPKADGIDMLRNARSNDCIVPILAMSDNDSTESCIDVLDAGADDCLAKPIKMGELSARMRALYRRSHGKADNVLTYRDIKINLTSHVASKADKAIELSRREFVLLLELVSNAGRIISKKQLEEKVYGLSEGIESNTIEVFIHHLRKKFGADIITTVRGVGYMVPEPAQ